MRGRIKAITNSDLEYPIDELIKPAVDILRENGFDTIESCQGGEGHACLEPMVRFNGTEFDLIRAMEVCYVYGLCVSEGRRIFGKLQDVYQNDDWENPIGRTYEMPTNKIVFYIHPKTGTIFLPD